MSYEEFKKHKDKLNKMLPEYKPSEYLIDLDSYEDAVRGLVKYLTDNLSFSSAGVSLHRFILGDGREAELQIKIETDKSKFSDEE